MDNNQNQDASGSDINSSGNDDQNKAGQENQDAASGDQGDQGNSVSFNSHQKLLNEKRSVSERLKAAEAKLSAAEKEQSDAKEASLRQKEDWKTLAETKEKDLLDAQTEVKLLRGQISDGTKINAFLEKMRESHGEVGQQYWGLVDLDKLEIDPETSLPTESSMTDVVNNYVQKFAQTIIRKDSAKITDNQGGQSNVGLTHKQWLALPLKEKKSRMKEVKKPQ